MNGSWTEYQRKVLSDIESIQEELERLRVGLNEVKVNMAVHSVKIGLWGIAGGAIPVIIALALQALKQ